MNETFNRQSGFDAIPLRDQSHYMNFGEVIMLVKRLRLHLKNHYHVWSHEQGVR